MKIDPPTWHPEPKRPDYTPPAGAVDAHCHVFGPGNRFPYAPERKYTPSDAPKEKLFELREHLGLSRNVIVQASCHGRDNAALLDALRADPEDCRGIAVVDPAISDDELRGMDAAGVRGIRFNFVRRLVDPDPQDVSARLAARVAELGWHVVVYFEAPDLEELAPFSARPALRRGDRPHGAARHRLGRRQPRLHVLPAPDGRQWHLDQGKLPRASLGRGSAL